MLICKDKEDSETNSSEKCFLMTMAGKYIMIFVFFCFQKVQLNLLEIFCAMLLSCMRVVVGQIRVEVQSKEP